MDLMYLTLTHLSHIDEQFLATHAYGMKMLNTWEVRPQGNGISEMGRAVVKMAYTLEVDGTHEGLPAKVPAPVMIDIKHMGLKSRLDLYAYRKQLQSEGLKLPPILASHMGVTGYTIEEWKSNLIRGSARVEGSPRSVAYTVDRQRAGNWGAINDKFTFNAWTINLMDEDIVEVLNSGGLIGISLDIRILGWNDAITKDEVEEFMSPEDFRYFFPAEATRLMGPATEALATESWFAPTKEERHTLAFCFNLLHVISVGLVAGRSDVWDRVCVGSDFDGLIDPMKNVKDASLYNNLPDLLMRWLPVAEKAYRKTHGGPALIPRNGKEADEAELRMRVDKVMCENGRNFLEHEWQ